MIYLGGTKTMSDQLEQQEYLTEKDFQEYKKSQRKWLIIFAVVSFAAMLGIVFVSLLFIDSSFIVKAQQANESVNRNYDYLQFVVPVLLAIGAFMAAALGINRLKNLDDQVDKIENRLRQKFEDLSSNNDSKIETNVQKTINSTASEFKESLAKEVENGKEEITAHTEEQVSNLDAEKQLILSEIRQESQTIKAVNDNVEEFSRKFGWLESIEKINSDIDVTSVADAHSFVEEIFRDTQSAKSDRVARAKIIFKKVVDGNLSGDKADYHNLAAEFARNEQKEIAIQICSCGLESFPEDVDLLADIIQFTTQIGEKKSGIEINDYVNRLNEIPMTSWTWRCFEFLTDYYISNKEYSNAETVCKNYVKYLPRDERGYAQYSEVYGFLYFGEDAESKKIEILKQAVEKGFPCPRCAHELSNIYANRGELDEAIKYSEKAILSLAQEQPSINYAYIFYNKALCEDRLFLSNKMKGTEDDCLAQNALKDYKIAIESGKLSVITTNQARVRYNILADMIGEDKLATSATSATDLLSLLSQLKADESET